MSRQNLRSFRHGSECNRAAKAVQRPPRGRFSLAMPLAAAAEAKKKKHRSRYLKAIQVRDISVDIRNIFDPTVPGEDNWLFRLANRLHIPTKPSVIRRELLVYPGDWTDLERVAERNAIFAPCRSSKKRGSCRNRRRTAAWTSPSPRRIPGPRSPRSISHRRAVKPATRPDLRKLIF